MKTNKTKSKRICFSCISCRDGSEISRGDSPTTNNGRCVGTQPEYYIQEDQRGYHNSIEMDDYVSDRFKTVRIVTR